MGTERFRPHGIVIAAMLALHMCCVARAPGQSDDHLLPAAPARDDSSLTAGTLIPGSVSARMLVLGAGIGTPGGMNFVGGAYFAPLAVRISGGYWGQRWNGIQGDISLLFNHNEFFAQGVSVVAGSFRTNPVIADNAGNDVEASKMVHYIGGAFDMYLAGFFLQIGLARGRGDYPNPQLVVQFAYLFAF